MRVVKRANYNIYFTSYRFYRSRSPLKKIRLLWFGLRDVGLSFDSPPSEDDEYSRLRHPERRGMGLRGEGWVRGRVFLEGFSPLVYSGCHPTGTLAASSTSSSSPPVVSVRLSAI